MQVAQHLAHEEGHASDSTDVFGFWLYIMTDCILFACLFATYLVLHYHTMEETNIKLTLDLQGVLVETFLLLFSNFTFCLSILSLYKNNKLKTQCWLAVTFLLGAGFIFLEVSEFIHLAQEGLRWDLSGKISSFFTLVGTHGLHVSFGLAWILIMILQIAVLNNPGLLKKRMTYLGLFWNFLDIVWVFVFTLVYLLGAL